MKHTAIRAKSFESWFKANFTRDEMKDIAEHGANSGFHDITYTTDLVHIYEHFHEDLWEMLCRTADDLGQAPCGVLADFNTDITDHYGLATALVWFGCEELSQESEGN